MRRLRGAGGGRAGALLPRACPRFRGAGDRDSRGAGEQRKAAPTAGGLCRPRRRAVRLLHPRDPDDGEGTARARAEPEPRTHRGGDLGESLPLHGLPADLRIDRGSGKNNPGVQAMTPRKRFEVIGKPRRRVDGRAKVTGLTRFADDIMLPRMLHCKLLRSPLPHAIIEAIDVSRAQAYPGVHLVLTGKDFPVTFGILPVTQDEYPLAPEHVRYVGDPVAAVVAKDEQTATQALDLIQVRYRVLDTISNPEEALAKPEPRIHAYSERGNIHRLQAFEFGNVEEAFARSDHVFEDLFFYEGNTHLPIEQHAAVAALDGEGKLTLWSSTQVPHYVHRCLARVLRVAASQIRVIACPNGGGFGGKCDVCNHEMVVAKAAMLLGRPVKICLNREEVFYMHRGRHPVLMKMRTGVTRDGKLTGMHVQTLVDGGGYGSYGVAGNFSTGALQTVTYELPRYKFDAARVFTNKPPRGPQRGPRTPQPRFGPGGQPDKNPEKLGMDPAELRLGIVAKPDSLTANWLKIGSIGLAECIRQVTARSDWKNRFKKLPYGRGVGIACGSYLCGAGLPVYWNKMPQCGVQLLLDRSRSEEHTSELQSPCN